MSVLERRGGEAAAPKRSYKAAEDRREQILECALETFATRGYHATSIADVCTAAGVARGTLYQYFEDKVDLLRALADQVTTRISDALAARLPLLLSPEAKPSEPDAVAFVEARIRDILEVVFGDARTARLILRAGRGAGVIDDILARLDRIVLGQLESELELAIVAGVVRPLDVHFVARFFLGGIEKSVLAQLDTDRELDIAQVAREAALLEVSGIFARPGAPGRPPHLARARREPKNAPARREPKNAPTRRKPKNAPARRTPSAGGRTR
jgi:AcrR family transcriptional regulator